MPPALRRSSPFLLSATIAVLCLVALPPPPPARRWQSDSRLRSAHDFERFLRRYEAANTAFVNGDASPWLRITAAKNPSRSSAASVAPERQASRSCFSATCSRRTRSSRAARRSISSTSSRTFRAGSRTPSRSTRQRPVHRTHPAAAADPARHDALPSRSRRVEDHPPPRRHDDRPAAADARGLAGRLVIV